MAKNDQNQAKKNEKSISSADKQKSRNKNVKKGAKGSFLTNFKKFFRDLKTELKRIIWPSKDKMIHSTAVVLSVILAAVLVIWAVDNIVNTVLTAAGFYDPLNIETVASTTTVSTSETESTTETDLTTEGTVEVTEPEEEAGISE